MNITIVNKEDLKNYHFVHHEVLPDSEKRKQRALLLDEALKLGNDFKTKVQLICQTTIGAIEVYTTVWAVTDNYIEIKAGTDIPIHCIIEVIK